jgi:hypothetical protein
MYQITMRIEVSGQLEASTMSLVTSAEEAEEVVKQWLEKKFAKKLKKVRVTHISLAHATWDVEAEVDLSSGVLSVEHQKLSLKVDSETAKVIGYSETD